MKPTLLVKLAPTPEQHASLLRPLEAFTTACNASADVAFAPPQLANTIARHKLVYYAIRQRLGWSAHMPIGARSKVAEASTRDNSIRPRFRPHGALGYDERIAPFPLPHGCSRLALDAGRARPCGLPLGGVCARYEAAAARAGCPALAHAPHHRRARQYRGGARTPSRGHERRPGRRPGGITLAAPSHRECLTHSTGPQPAEVHQVRARARRLRRPLQQQDPTSSKRLLTKRSGREGRFVRDVTQCRSKALLSTAHGTGRGIALEELQHLRRPTPGNTQRQRSGRHRWAFAPGRAFLAYQAQLAGGRVGVVTPADTRQPCSRCGHCGHCGHCERATRQSPAKVLWGSCGYSAHADLNAAVHMRSQAALIPPNAAAFAS